MLKMWDGHKLQEWVKMTILFFEFFMPNFKFELGPSKKIYIKF